MHDIGAGHGVAGAGVSVVVPAYNAGPYLDRCLQSLIDQTLDRSRYDVIVVDDGSTDGTAERLDRAAREHPGLIRVEHIANSGWPGRPRNVGTDLSRRRYVFYCDADDWLLPRALEVMLDRAVADDADLVMARPFSNRRRVSLGIYEQGDRCTNWQETPGVFSNMTCQKMFRREFLREREVRFGEGRVRLEDFIFMTAAYLRAERISIIGSQACYVFELRDDGGNLTASRATEQEYFSSVEKIIDVILADVPAGPLQDRALDRVLQSELLRPLSRPPLLRKAPDVQAEVLARARQLLKTKVPPSAVARLDPVNRNRARAVERGDLAEIIRRIEWEDEVALSAIVEDVSWVGARLQLRVTLALQRHGAVLRLEQDGARLLLPRASVSDDPVEATRPMRWTSAPMRLRSRENAEEWRVAPTLKPVPDDGAGQPLAWTATVVIDVQTVAGGRPLGSGVWDLLIYFQSCGYHRIGRPRAIEGGEPAEPPTGVHEDRRVRPYWTRSGALALTVRPADQRRSWRERGRTAAGRARRTLARVRRQDRELTRK